MRIAIGVGGEGVSHRPVIGGAVTHDHETRLKTVLRG